MSAATALFALSAGTSVALAASAANPPQTLFECSDQRWRVSLLGTDDGRLVLLTAPHGRGMGNAQSAWDEVRQGYVVGQQGGHQSHIRLYDGVRHIILFEGEDGQLADRPGRTYAGAVTQTARDPQQDFSVVCAADAINGALVENLIDWAERTGVPRPEAEEPDSPFNGWF